MSRLGAHRPPRRCNSKRTLLAPAPALALALALASLAPPGVSATLFGADLGEVTWSAAEAAMPFADLVKHCSPFQARRWAPATRSWSWESDAAVAWSSAANASLGPGLPLRIVGSGVFLCFHSRNQSRVFNLALPPASADKLCPRK